MTGDQRICKGRLRKVICPESGVVANEFPFTDEEISVFYGEVYELNTYGKEEHFFYTQNGPVPRSKVFHDWIRPHILANSSQILEVGCGEGNFLRHLTGTFPDKNIIGFDGSYKAVDSAQKKGLNVSRKIITGDDRLPPTDVLIMINVLEHIENIENVLKIVKKSLNKNGRAIFCIPVQDWGGYDIFFSEHVWHFTVKHFQTILNKNGFSVVFSDARHPVNHGIGLFVCEACDETVCDNNVFSEISLRNLQYWESAFSAIDHFPLENRKIAIFGAGEIATLFLAFTSLKLRNIVACIDDSKENGASKHGIPVHKSQWLFEHADEVDVLLLTVNKKYHRMLSEKFGGLRMVVQPVY